MRNAAGPQSSTIRWLAVYYVVTGLWPVVWYRSFRWVTGPKDEIWLVRTFGLVLAAFGAAAWTEARQGRSAAGPVVAVSTAIAAAETWYVLRGRIRPVYLADALIELVAVRRLWGSAS